MASGGKTPVQMLKGVISKAKNHFTACSGTRDADDNDAPLKQVVAAAPSAATAAADAARPPLVEPAYDFRVQ